MQENSPPDRKHQTVYHLSSECVLLCHILCHESHAHACSLDGLLLKDSADSHWVMVPGGELSQVVVLSGELATLRTRVPGHLYKLLCVECLQLLVFTCVRVTGFVGDVHLWFGPSRNLPFSFSVRGRAQLL